MNSYLYYGTEFIYKKILPFALRIELMRFMNPNYYKLRRDIISYLTVELRENPDSEKEEVLKILKKNPLYMIPYGYGDVFPVHKIAVMKDSTGGGGGKYVLHDGKKLFFPGDWSDFKVQYTYRSLLLEQGVNSPHRYETGDFCVLDGDIIADCGAAEGIWALSSVEKAKKVYLFECDERWMNILKKTFEPWKEKVEIVNKFVSDKSSENNVTLDDFFGEGGVDFIKADIEGAEISMLRGAEKILSARKNLKLSLCTYHRQNDAGDLDVILKEHGFLTSFSHGYMLMIYGDEPLEAPYLRRGMIRAKKNV
jgi:hypothetical protein